jgi:hypothetical protein
MHSRRLVVARALLRLVVYNFLCAGSLALKAYPPARPPARPQAKYNKEDYIPEKQGYSNIEDPSAAQVRSDAWF